MTGAQVLEALENGVSMYPRLEGRFPAVSGVSFTFDAELPPGSRVVPGSVRVGGAPLDMTRQYSVATREYLSQGKDGYDVFTRAKILKDREQGPIIPNLLRNHFVVVKAVNKMKMIEGKRPLRRAHSKWLHMARRSSVRDGLVKIEPKVCVGC